MPHNSEPVGAIILASGQGKRMRGKDKVFSQINGSPLISYAIKVFDNSPFIDRIVLVVSSQNVRIGRDIMAKYASSKSSDVCTGGQRRQDSVRCGLQKLVDVEWVVVHDGARPLIEADMIEKGLDEARPTGAAIAAVPVTDTVKSVDDSSVVSATVSRDMLFTIQTPQIFRRNILEDAHLRITTDVTDDAAMIEMLGGSVRTFEGSRKNFKITTPEDLDVVRAILEMER